MSHHELGHWINRRTESALPWPRTRCDVTIGTSCKPLAADVDKARQTRRAAVLGIGTANPANCVPQEEYADWYFRVTKSDHLTRLKAKMKKICETLMIVSRSIPVF